MLDKIIFFLLEYMQETEIRNWRSQIVTFKWIHHEESEPDLLALTQNQPLSKKNMLFSLTPFLDERVMRIGRKLSKAAIHSSAEDQLIIPDKHHVVQLLIQYYEISHLGTEYVLSAIKQRFWVINSRLSVKQIRWGCTKPNEPR